MKHQHDCSYSLMSSVYK